MSIPLSDIFDEFKAAKIRTGQTSDNNFREIAKYIKFQNARGYKYLTYRACVEFLEERRKVLSDFALQESYQMLRHFSRWAHLVNDSNEELPRKKRRLSGRRIPTILNPGQIADLMIRMRTTCSHRPLSAQAYSTLIGLLYVTGMRISEALIGLSDADVNLEENYIYVREGKAARDRYIPISASTSAMLAKYRKLREKRFPGRRDRFFLIYTGAPKGTSSFRTMFVKVASELGYRPSKQKDHETTRLVPHDLRHSYATNMLTKFHQEELDIDEELPKLSIVLGHHSIRETYWYIESVPELLSLILNRKSKNAR